MSNLLERIEKQFDGATVHQIEVPEWGEKSKPLVVCFTNTTLKQAAEAMRLVDNDPVLFQARIITIKAMDIDGEHLFKMAEANWLADHASPAVLARLAAAIAPNSRADDTEKN